MTSYCDQCHRNDHESCMRVIDNLRLCRNCLIKHPKGDFVFGCKCGEWDYKKVEKMLEEEGNFIKCKKCEGAICVIYQGVVSCDCQSLIKEKILSYLPADPPECEKKKIIDQVNHPSHYQSNGLEVIDVIEAFSLGFPLGNAIKYILRADKKDDRLQDLKKAAWYLNYEIEKIEDWKIQESEEN